MDDPTITRNKAKAPPHGCLEGNKDNSQHKDLMQKSAALLEELSAIRIPIEDACIENNILLDSLHMICPLESNKD